jgi:hypothetical protein
MKHSPSSKPGLTMFTRDIFIFIGIFLALQDGVEGV